MGREEDVFWIEEVFDFGVLDGIDDTGLEVYEASSRNVAFVVGLVEEDIFAVSTGGGKVFEDAVVVDAVFGAELFPKLGSDL